MLSLAAFNEPLAALDALRKRGPRGLDVQAPARPEQSPVLPAPPGTDWGSAIGQLVGSAAIGKAAKPEAPTFSSAAESARANTPGFVGGQGAMTKPGTQFLDPAKLDIDGALKPKSFVQMFGQGGTLRKPGEVAVVGENEPELAVRGRKGETSVIPLSVVEEGLRGLMGPQPSPTVEGGGVLGEGQSPAVERPRRAEPGIALSALSDLTKPAERPRMIEPRGETPDEARLAGLEGQRQVEREHPEQGGRGIKQTLIASALGALQGYGATGSWEGAAGGAGAGAGANLIDPKILPELQRQQREAGYQQEIKQIGAREDAELERAGRVAGVRKTAAETERILHPAVKLNVQIVKGRGGFYAVDKNKPDAQPLRLPIDPDVPDKPPTMFDWMGQRMTVVPDGQGGWKAEPLAGVERDESQVPVPYQEDGQSFTVKPGEALRAASQVKAANIGAEAQGGANTVTAENENSDRQWKARVEAWKLEGERARDYNAIHDELDETFTKRNALRKSLEGVNPEEVTDPKEKEKLREKLREKQATLSGLDEQFDRLKKQAQAARDALNPEYVEFRPDERARSKPQPAPPRVKVKPAPARRSGGVSPVPSSKDPLGLFK